MSGRGSGRYMQSLISYFKPRKHQISIVEGMRSELAILKDLNVKTVHLPFQIPVYQGRADVKRNVKISTVSDLRLLRIARRFAESEMKIHDRIGLDIVHANHVSILPYAANMARVINGVPYVITAHGTGMLSSLENKRNFNISKFGLENSEKIIANSKFTKNGLVKDFGISKNKIKVIYPGVNTDVFKPSSRRVNNAVRRKYRLTGKKVVMSSGYFSEEKGFQYLIEAAEKIEKEDKDIVMIFTGQGPYQKEMERQIKQRGLKNTKMLGWVLRKDLIKLYGASDLFVTPSIWDEPFGLVSVEALASRTPVIATRVGGIPEIVGRDVGEIVPPKSSDAIADAVLNRISDRCWLRKKGMAGREKVIKKFSVKAGGRETEKVYIKAMK